MKKFNVIDLHCDLLSYLVKDSKRTFDDPESRCSRQQLQEGGVKFQVFAIFTKTDKNSVSEGQGQLQIYSDLLSSSFKHEQLMSAYAFENASGFCDEQEPLKNGLQRLEGTQPLYIGLTWNAENRFGGGSSTTVGLKKDGEVLLDLMAHLQIALDLSHASDQLFEDALAYINTKQLKLPVLASHSNARAINDVSRNLPLDFAQQIWKQGGVIGLNLYRPFLGIFTSDIIQHVEYWLENGGEDHLCLGADFFCVEDLSFNPLGGFSYFDDYDNASCYGALLQLLQKELRLSDLQIQKIAWQNAWNFLNTFNGKKSTLLFP